MSSLQNVPISLELHLGNYERYKNTVFTALGYFFGKVKMLQLEFSQLLVFQIEGVIKKTAFKGISENS